MSRKELIEYLPREIVKIVLSYNDISNYKNRMYRNKYKMIVRDIKTNSNKSSDKLNFSKIHFEKLRINKILNEMLNDLIVVFSFLFYLLSNIRLFFD